MLKEFGEDVEGMTDSRLVENWSQDIVIAESSNKERDSELWEDPAHYR